MKRRTFIRATGLAAVGTAITPKNILAGGLPKKKPFTIILGSGLAGLGAAKHLKDAGCDYVILEARKRTGGRVNTFIDPTWDGLSVEFGAEWIGKSHVELQKFNNEQGLSMEDHTFNTRLLFNGTFQNAGEWQYDETSAIYNKALEQYRNADEKTLKALDKLDYWRYLHQIGISEKNIEIREYLDSTDFGETIRNVSAFAALSEYAFSSEKNEMDLWTKGGNSRMVEALVKYVGEEKVKLDHKVTTVSQNKKKIKVTCANGAVIEGDKLICCIPTFSISKIKWEPAFSSSKRDALDALQYCRIIKTSLLFSERIWKDESFDMLTDTLGHYFFHSSKLQPGTKGILTSYAIGEKAEVIAKMSKEKKMKEITNCLTPAFGDVSKYNLDAMAYYWGNDPYSKGAYAIYDINQWFSHRLELLERSGNIFFAGEHLAEWQGFMEGAFVSGMDAAKAVIKS